VQTFTVQLPGLEQRLILRGRELLEFHAAGSRTSILEADAELFHVIAERFGLVLTAAEMARLSTKLAKSC
jgi:hypothetical protein